MLWYSKQKTLKMCKNLLYFILPQKGANQNPEESHLFHTGVVAKLLKRYVKHFAFSRYFQDIQYQIQVVKTTFNTVYHMEPKIQEHI